MKEVEISDQKTAGHRYYSFGRYMKDLYHEPIYKVNVDAGFTCPNRDGTLGEGGCIYCNNKSFRPAACTRTLSVRDQIEKGIPYLQRRYGAKKFIVYFQPYTNTHADVDVLDRVYHEALEHPAVVGLAIGTRPDCINEEKIQLLETLARDYFILVEYGLQSIYDKTLSFINRGHTYACFQEALQLTAGKGIRIGAHIILGFPTETREEMLGMAEELSQLPIEFLKIHQLQVIRDTALADAYARDQFQTFGYREWIEMLGEFLVRLSPHIVLQRLFAAAPDDILIAPIWNKTRSELLLDLDKYMVEKGLVQGMEHSSNSLRVPEFHSQVNL
ncbi:MAG: TIGR01212 family radical SAM protein [Nitrospirota bacterium]